MRRLILWNVLTLDGFFEGSESWQLDFHETVWGKELEQFSIEQLKAADLLLFGRITYEGMASHWQTTTGEIADLMNSISKIVFSRTLNAATWANTRLVQAEAVDEVARLKEEPGKDILIFGSANLASTLIEAGLIDEYRLGLAPILLGNGNPLFKGNIGRMQMELLEARPLQTGCVFLRYRPIIQEG